MTGLQECIVVILVLIKNALFTMQNVSIEFHITTQMA